tara:strand:- start:863 stop:1213 length:351 start_codon:yes stop_codon:yes gene_type:complete
MLDMNKINLWSLGIKWNNNNNSEIIKGISRYDNSISYLKITTNKNIQQIKYWLGENINKLYPRIYVYVIKTKKIDVNKLLIVSYRTQNMNNERWNKLKELHIKEVKIIKNLIENDN